MKGKGNSMRYGLLMCCLYCIVALSCVGKGLQRENAVKNECMSDNIESQEIELSDFSFLTKGMSYAKIKEILKNPGTPVGFGVIIISYKIKDGSFLILNFGPYNKGLVSAYIAKPNGERRQLIE